MESVQINASTPKELAELIEGRSDTEINQVLDQLNLDDVLSRVFEGMIKAFLPQKAGTQSAVIQWDIKAKNQVHPYQIKVADGNAAYQQGAPGPARVTLAVELPNFLRLITGKMNGQQAFFTGKLKVSGDMMFAMTQEGWFDKNWGG